MPYISIESSKGTVCDTARDDNRVNVLGGFLVMKGWWQISFVFRAHEWN